MSDIKDFLKSVEMFIGLNDEMLDKVANLCDAKNYTPDTLVIERNSPADDFYLIQEGTVNILTSPSSEEQEQRARVIVTLGKGQSFGEMGLIDSGTRSASVKSATNALLLKINCSRFRDLCEADTDLGYKIMKNIAIDLSFKLRSRNLI
jgi:CRP/FNR family cyclic AMP-dependent transcriptional regulator